VGLVLGGGTLTVSNVLGRQWQQSAAFHLTDGHVSVSEERVELLHKVLADQVREVDLVEGVAQHGQEDLLYK